MHEKNGGAIPRFVDSGARWIIYAEPGEEDRLLPADRVLLLFRLGSQRARGGPLSGWNRRLAGTARRGFRVFFSFGQLLLF